MADHGIPLAPAPGHGKGKGKGKSKGIIPLGTDPPTMAKGKGRGKGPPIMANSKGKGKGLVPGKAAPPPPGAQPQLRREAPPEHLMAPPGVVRLPLRANRVQSSGTIWEGLDPWGSNEAGQFPSWRVNFDRLRELWAPMEEVPTHLAPQHTVANEERVMDQRMQQTVEIVVRSLKLQPDKIHEALRGDFDALTPQQIRGLAGQIVPAVRVTSGLLQALVQRRGVASLPSPEAVLWAVASTPLGEARAQTLALRVQLPEDKAMLQERVEPAVKIVQRLRQSLPLKMLMQAVLVVRSVLSQHKCTAFPIRELGSIIKHERYRRMATAGAGAGRFTDWYQENIPSTLRLVAEIVADSHANYNQLRFITMAALSKACRLESARRCIWSYLGSPIAGGSVLDACKLLQDCDSRIFDPELANWVQSRQLYRDRAINGHVRPLQAYMDAQPLQVEAQLREHLDVVSKSINDTQEAFRTGWNDLMQAALDVCDLIGEPRPTGHNRNGKILDIAAAALQHLRTLGTMVREEVELVWFMQRRRRLQALPQQIRTDAALGRSGFCARAWQPVDTRLEILATTGDPDLVREMRSHLRLPEERSAAQAKAAPETKDKAKADAAPPPPKAKGAPQKYVDLIHSGIEGVYARDPITGKWGRRADGVDGQVRDITRRGGASA
mmetsp:Transcript_84277/g.219318  ORF Transcript_84277/g.219318 Transcript_84277/m.219318 type:complete len:666 (-) Transcript_84277:351-2348(-)